ncbi:Methyl-CpG-binding domain protein 4 [Colletotrichum trifolii]|uniref:Methyl-CpG-binding domain protein 4 n=1 Tax=Colletotrichum trifolii TaxID=5466 RepID=A0A4R8RE42_COLTR|nr:Methyl-CpG-binding domain protein 4 [Colletotrichum trifolii]
MTLSTADDVFVGFDVSDKDKPFLMDVLAHSGTPLAERLTIYDVCLFSGFEDWHLLLERAATIKDSRPAASELEARDLLAFVPKVTEAARSDERLRKGWEATDQSIKNLSNLLRVHRTGVSVQSVEPVEPERRVLRREVVKREREHDEAEDEPRQRFKRQRTVAKLSTSHYFAHSADEQAVQRTRRQSPSPAHATGTEAGTSAVLRNGITTPRNTPRKPPHDNETAPQSSSSSPPSHRSARPEDSQASSGSRTGLAQPQQHSLSGDLVRIILPRRLEFSQVRGLGPPSVSSPRPKAAVKSHFFTQPQVKQSPRSKRSAGLVSTIPFPPLSATKFGLIQEEFAHDPFWLLVVVTFLVKTAGTLAIPTFYKVKGRFPSPADLADPEVTAELTGMIHHLGLSVVRTAAVQRYARVWLNDPPTAGVLYRVKNYDKRDIDLDGNVEPGQIEDAWEIGHFTQGKYALDSWRIFCRDELLGRAKDWNGGGAAPNFQPEWMRVRPDDKELRACLRWMWMREGWEWDPVTGEKTVLREEMRKAANERRVEYDDMGGLRMLVEPRDDST